MTETDQKRRARGLLAGDIGWLLQHLRLARKISVREAARVTGLSFSTIREVEKGSIGFTEETRVLFDFLRALPHAGDFEVRI